jgi:serine/threonine protein phosphatase PrpC
MRYGNRTDVGRQREHNEDNLLSSSFSFGQGRRRISYALHVVADGMGGAAAGEVASALTVETITLTVYQSLLATHVNAEQSYINLSQVLAAAVEAANERVYMTAREIPQFLGMGATVTAMMVCQGRAYFAQVGDSRGYLVRGGQIRQITRDHSFVGELLREGRITEEQARNHPRKNIITRAVGSRRKVQVDTFCEVLEPGDALMACSDGLSGMVSDPDIAATIAEGVAKKMNHVAICDQLVHMANEAGGNDNISCVVVEIGPEDLPPHPMDQVCLVPEVTLTWEEAARLGLDDSSFERVDPTA